MTKKDKRRIVLVGAGGHAKVVIEAMRSAKRLPVVGLDAKRELWGKSLEGVLIKGSDDLLKDYPPSCFVLANGVGAPRDTSVRRRLHEALKARGYDFPPVVAASALVSSSATLGEGAQVLTRAIVHPAAVVGAGAIVNTGAIVEHDCVVGDHAHVCPGAVLCGGVQVGAGAFIGAGAVVIPGISIGARAVVGAGVVVRKDVADGGKALPLRRRRAA